MVEYISIKVLNTYLQFFCVTAEQFWVFGFQFIADFGDFSNESLDQVLGLGLQWFSLFIEVLSSRGDGVLECVKVALGFGPEFIVALNTSNVQE